MSSETITQPKFRLGNVVFSVANCQPDLVRDLEKLLPHATSKDLEQSTVRQIDMGTMDSAKDLRSLTNKILKRHLTCLWVDAACTVSPNGKKVMLSGASHSGKSTTSLALALGYGWRVLCEDITLIDPKKDEILNFGTPFSLKSGTVELLLETISKIPEPIINGEWVPMGNLNFGSNLSAPFDVVVHLERQRLEPQQERPPIEWRAISRCEYLRKILPFSNTMRQKNGTDKFLEYVREDGCYLVSGGTLKERIQLLSELTGEQSKMDSAGLSTLYKRHPQVESRLLPDGHLVLFNSNTNWGQTLTPLGAIVWEFCDGTTSIESIFEQLKELDSLVVTPELEQQVISLLEDLADTGLIESI